ncbi:MAG: DNA-3-methyladenine glycosylase 2 family protein, partial [Ahrensia sp.]
MTIETDHDIATGLATLLTIDPRLKPIAATAGPLPLRRQPPGFGGLARIIIAQQVSKQSADAIAGR